MLTRKDFDQAAEAAKNCFAQYNLLVRTNGNENACRYATQLSDAWIDAQNKVFLIEKFLPMELTKSAGCSETSAHQLSIELGRRVCITIDLRISPDREPKVVYWEGIQRDRLDATKIINEIKWHGFRPTDDFGELLTRLKIECSKAWEKYQAGAPGKPKAKAATVNQRMLEAVSEDSTMSGWTSTKWAKHLGCSPSRVRDTNTWKTLLSLGRDKKSAIASSKRNEIGQKRKTKSG